MKANDKTNRNAEGNKMSRNTLRTSTMESSNPQLNSTPRPGDYELGSEESRAAARSMLEATYQRNKLRVVVECLGRPDLEQRQPHPECQRYLCADGTLMEMVLFAQSRGGFSSAELEPVISRIPIDGKSYGLENLIANFGG